MTVLLEIDERVARDPDQLRALIDSSDLPRRFAFQILRTPGGHVVRIVDGASAVDDERFGHVALD